MTLNLLAKQLGKIVILFLSLFFLSGCGKNINGQEIIHNKDYSHYNDQALSYARNKGLSTDFYILVDLSIRSGKRRLFIVDLNKGFIRQSFMVTHGSGGGSTDGSVVFSNVPNSHSSSKGKYILGSNKVYSPGYRHKYIMYGQESSNSNAVIRNVVFHPWVVVPNTETYPYSIPMSWGCPAVSEDSFEQIDNLIQQTDKRVLMWII